MDLAEHSRLIQEQIKTSMEAVQQNSSNNMTSELSMILLGQEEDETEEPITQF